MIPGKSDLVLLLVARIAAAGVCIRCVEQLSERRFLSLFDYYGGDLKSEQPLFVRVLARFGGLTTLLTIRLGLAVIIAGNINVNIYWKYLVTMLLVFLLLTSSRIPFIQSGDELLTLITYTAISLTLFCDTAVTSAICLRFLSLQLCLAYFFAGYHKAVSPEWRSGTAIPAILSTRTFGWPKVGLWLNSHHLVAITLSWLTIAWELLFPLVLVTNFYGAVIFVICGILFHVSLAIMMGLNKFIWAFGALYPALLFCKRSQF